MTITLATLSQASPQKVLNHVAAHLLAQKRKSRYLFRSLCRYRGPGDLKWAAGCLIGDEEYDSRFEGKDWEVLIALGWIPSAHSSLIVDLQKIHDNESENIWEEKLKSLAAERGLAFNFKE